MHRNTKVRLYEKIGPFIGISLSILCHLPQSSYCEARDRKASYTKATGCLFIVLTLISVLKNPTVLCRGSGEGYVGVGAWGQRVLLPFYPCIGCGHFWYATLYQKSELCIPRNKTARPRYQFLHSCICERYSRICFLDCSIYRWTDRGNIYT